MQEIGPVLTHIWRIQSSFSIFDGDLRSVCCHDYPNLRRRALPTCRSQRVLGVLPGLHEACIPWACDSCGSTGITRHHHVIAVRPDTFGSGTPGTVVAKPCVLPSDLIHLVGCMQAGSLVLLTTSIAAVHTMRFARMSPLGVATVAASGLSRVGCKLA